MTESHKITAKDIQEGVVHGSPINPHVTRPNAFVFVTTNPDVIVVTGHPNGWIDGPYKRVVDAEAEKIERLKQLALWVQDYEDKYGVITDEDVEAATKELGW